MNAFEADRSKLSGLHFAQDAMRPHERETLYLGEAMLRRLDAVLELHVPQQDEPYSLVQYRYCRACGFERHTDSDGESYMGPTIWPCPTVRAITGEDPHVSR